MDLKTYLTTNKITHGAFAEKLGVSQATVTRYVHNKREPSLKMVFRIEELTRKKVRASDWSGLSAAIVEAEQ